MNHKPEPAHESEAFLKDFRDMVRSLGSPKRRMKIHPPLSVLQAYMSGDLPDTWPPSALDDDREPERWTLSDVSIHASRCLDCSDQLAQWRKPVKRGWIERIFAFGGTGRVVRVWAWSSAALALLLIAMSLNWNSQIDAGPAAPVLRTPAAPSGAYNLVANQNGMESGARRAGAGATVRASDERAPAKPEKYNTSPLMNKNLML
jgi:hypothetical protein